MSIKTKIMNPTKVRQRYQWVPKHGLTLEAGESIEIEGTIEAKIPRQKKIMITDVESGRVSIIVKTDAESTPEDKVIPVEAPKEKAPAKEKEIVVKGDSLADENIAVEPVTDEVELSIPGVVPVDENEKNDFYDERGNLLPPDADPIEVTNIYDIDEDDILAKAAFENKEEPEEEKNVEIPSESVVKKMNKSTLTELADTLGVEYDEDETKKEIIVKIDALR